MLRSAKLRVAAALVATGVLASACGGGSGSSDDKDRVFRFGELSGAAETLDPHLNAQSYGTDWFGPAYESLLRVDRTGELHPWLAKSWEYAPDGKTLTFKLNDGVKFSDGTPFDAEAVKANIERVKSLKNSPAAGDLADIDSVEVVDDLTVAFKLKQPSAIVATRLAGAGTSMVSPAAFDGKVDLDVKPVGTGPFKLTKYQPGESATYGVNDKYWGEKPSIGGVNIKVYADSSAGTNALTTGQIDMYPVLESGQEKTIKGAGLPLVDVPGTAFEWISLNFGDKFKDPKVREALSYASDREALVKFAGRGEPAWQWALKESDLYDPALEEPQPYDPAKAKQLLAEAGYANGFEFTLAFSARPYTEASAQIMQQQWAKAGFKVKLAPADGATIVQNCFVKRSCDALGGVHDVSPDFAAEVQDLFVKGAPRNMGQTELEGIDAPLAEALKPSDDRNTALKALQVAVTERIPYLILRTDPSIMGVSKDLDTSFDLSPDDTPIWTTLKFK